MHHRIRLALTLLISFIAPIPQAYSQQAWRPDKTVELIVPSGAGGSNDKIARTIQRIVQNEKLVPVPVSVVNKTGGNQTVARAYMNQHPGDAHYFNVGTTTLLSNHIMGVSPQHHRDFSTIAMLSKEYTTFVVRADSPMRTAKDLLERLKKDPDSVPIGVSNLGGTNHLTVVMTAHAAGIDPKKLKFVVFKTNSEGMTAVLGGHLQMVSGAVPSVMSQVAAGTARMIAIAAPRRMEGQLAEVPTLREAGVNVAQSNWRMIVGPRGLSPAQIAYWEEVLARAVENPEWKKELVAQHWENSFLRSAGATKFLDAEYAQMRAILVEIGMAK